MSNYVASSMRLWLVDRWMKCITRNVQRLGIILDSTTSVEGSCLSNLMATVTYLRFVRRSGLPLDSLS